MQLKDLYLLLGKARAEMVDIGVTSDAFNIWEVEPAFKLIEERRVESNKLLLMQSGLFEVIMPLPGTFAPKVIDECLENFMQVYRLLIDGAEREFTEKKAAAKLDSFITTLCKWHKICGERLGVA